MNKLETAKVGLSGKIASWEVVNSDGSIAQACYEPKGNLILDVGLDMVAAYNSITSCFAYLALGTGTSASAVGMTGLENETTYGGTTRPPASGYSAYNSTTIPAADADPFVVVYQIGIQTALAKLNGTFTELGFGPTSAKGANLFSRFRIVDSGGLPTSVTVGSDQQLRLKYQLNVRFLPIVATAYQCAITGLDDTFDYTAGWQGITANSFTTFLAFFGTDSANVIGEHYGDLQYPSLLSVTDSFEPLTTYHAVNLHNVHGLGISVSRDAYVAGTYSNYINVTFPTLACVGNCYGLAVCYYQSPGVGALGALWLAIFDTPIVKPDTHSIAFKLKFSWGRDT